MALDTSIPLQARPATDFLESYGRAMSLAQLAQQGRAQQMQLDKAQRDLEDEQRYGEAIRTGYGPDGKFNEGVALSKIAELAPSRYLPAQKQFADAAKARVELNNLNSQIDERGVKTQREQFGLSQDQQRASVQRIAAYSTPQDAAADLQAAVQRGEVPQHVADLLARAIPTDPAQFGPWKLKLAMGVMDPDKMAELLKPMLGQRDTGGALQETVRDPMTGAVTVVGTTAKTQSPDSKASVGAQYAIAAANREQAQATRDAARIQRGQADEDALRKEFADLPETKNLKLAAPAYEAVVKAAKGNNAQADINLIYGLAKLYDPNSVVREGEYDTIARSQSVPEWIKGAAQRLAGGGRLTDETKKQILEQAGIRIGTFRSAYDGSKGSYREIALRRGMNPDNVFAEVRGSEPTAPPSAEQNKPAGARRPLSDFQR